MSSFDVQLLGEKLSIRTEHDSQYVKAISERVRKLLEQLKKNAPMKSDKSIALMAALALADALSQAEIQHQQLRHTVQEEHSHLSSVFDRLESLIPIKHHQNIKSDAVELSGHTVSNAIDARAPQAKAQEQEALEWELVMESTSKRR